MTSPEQQDLAAAFRLAAHFGFHEGICNHFSVALKDGSYLLNPHGIHWSKLAPTDLLAVEPSSVPQSAELTALNIHGAIHQAYDDARCVLHTHMPYATALTCLDQGRLKYVHQNSLRFWDDIAYDDIYNGLADTPDEGQRIATAMDRKRVLFLANHGVIVTGKTVAEAFDRLYYLERACEVQVLAMSTGQNLREIGPNLAAKTRHEFDTNGDYAQPHFEALKTLLTPL
ncbi:MAG: hypothetical protein GKR90_24125 [Pseudomonadales bacterium]|nr:hypothetical protein [Pseudomonadales bacterium]